MTSGDTSTATFSIAPETSTAGSIGRSVSNGSVAPATVRQ
ncbi:Uncharacterised protein [Mycobacteroides abscessus subsp. abscessus]|nr:Uncharacterised protein [Mycobacteroides abscessus subsp. abscessus]